MERVLGEVPNVTGVHWDWKRQVAFVRFAPGKRADKDALAHAFDEGTMFSGGEVTYLMRREDLPDALR